MEDNINQAVAESTISDEELELELDLNDNEDVEVLRQKLEEKDRTLKQILARAKKAEAQAKAKPQTINNKEQSVQYDEEILDLRLDGYTRDEVNFIARNGGKKALEDKNSYTSIAINTIREQKKAEQASSQTADTSGMSEFERKYTPEMLRNMTSAELAKIVPHA